MPIPCRGYDSAILALKGSRSHGDHCGMAFAIVLHLRPASLGLRPNPVWIL
jgi:hypothetical protein